MTSLLLLMTMMFLVLPATVMFTTITTIITTVTTSLVPPAMVMFITITTVVTTITTSLVPPATVMFITTTITTTITIITSTTTMTIIIMILLCGVAIITAPACLHEVLLLHLAAAIHHSIQDIGTELMVVPRAMMARLARLWEQCDVAVSVIVTVVEHYIVVIHLHTRILRSLRL